MFWERSRKTTLTHSQRRSLAHNEWQGRILKEERKEPSHLFVSFNNTLLSSLLLYLAFV